MPDPSAQDLQSAIAGLEAQRSLLGDAVVDSAIAALRDQLERRQRARSAPELEERKIVTIVFVDVSGFTALAEKLDPEEVRSVINSCFDALVPIVQRYEGTIDKFIGDEIMALFGAPIAHENDPERALRVALEMMAAITRFNERQETTLSLHIGVNTGPVVTGAIGSKERKDYSVMGDAVNLAARLEDASADGEIYVGPSTYRLTGHVFHFAPLPALQLKGKSEPLVAYRLIGLKERPESPRGIEGVRTEIIGRDAELHKIRDACSRLHQRSGGVVSVLGEAGVGKSRLISESLAKFASKVHKAEGRALSHTAGMDYWMARSLLHGLLGTSEHTPIEQAQSALRASIEITELPIESVYPYLATLLQLPLIGDMAERVRFLSTEALQGRILQAFRELVQASAKQHPLILIWEDVHWCDPSSLLVLENLIRVTVEAALLIVLAYRNEKQTAETLQQMVRSVPPDKFGLVQLSPLTPQQSESLVQKLLQVAELPPQARDLILNRAEGNPFFIEELLRTLLDSGALARHHGVVTANVAIGSAQLPETVQGVISARMDRLSPEEKNVLQTAAVIGRVFDRRILEQVFSSDLAARLDACLAELTRRDFLHSVAGALQVDREFTFKHAITHDVAYQALLKARRKQLHGKVGEVMERSIGERAAEFSPTLAYHFERAEQPEKAFRYSRQAGERAQAVFANSEASAFYRSAIEQGTKMLGIEDALITRLRLAEIYEALGNVLHLSGTEDEARESYESALKLLNSDQRLMRSRVHRKIGSTYTVRRRYAAMSAAFEAAERELGPRPIEPVDQWWIERMQVLLERLHLYYWQGMADEMMDLAGRYRADVETKGTPMQRGKFFQMLGLSDLTRARYVASERSVGFMELAVSTSRDSPDLAEASHVRFTAGLAHLFRGNLEKSIEHYQAALQLAERVGDLIVQVRCLTYLSVAYRRSREQGATLTFSDRAIALADQLGMVEYVAMARASLSWLAWSERRYSDGKALGQEALKLWHQMEDPYGVDWEALLPLIAIATAEQRWDEAIEYARGLFGENQHPIPPSLDEAARLTVDVPATDTLNKKEALEHLIKTAVEIGYL
ncbi:MAG: ATP-binding protein [Chthoniobacterales bacterium]